MESWMLPLLLLSLGAVTMALPPLQGQLSYQEAVSLAIDLHNQEPEVERAFRLLEAKPQPEWDASGQSLQGLEFTLQETTCPPSKQLNLEECAFKEDGEVKECYGTVFMEQGTPVVQYRCEAVGQHIRVRRGLKKIVKKIKKKVKNGLKKIFSGSNTHIAHGGRRGGGRKYIA